MRLLLLALVAAAVVQAQSAIQACSLLKMEEVQRELGKPVQMSQDGDACVYNSSEGKRATIAVERSAGRGGAGVIEKYKIALPNAKVSEIRGLGDRAVRLEHPALGGVVSAFLGDVNVAVSVTGMRPGKAAGVAENLARKAIARVK